MTNSSGRASISLARTPRCSAVSRRPKTGGRCVPVSVRYFTIKEDGSLDAGVHFIYDLLKQEDK